MKREKSGFWVSFTASVFYPVGALLARRHYREARHVPRSGGALLVMNHVSHIDPVYDTVFVHKQGRNPHVFAKHSLWKYPLVRHVMSGSGQIPVYRASAAAGHSLSAGAQALREGKVVIIYPDGTITKDPDGWPMQPRTGVARLVLDVLDEGIPVIPVARWGTLDILDGYQKKFRPFPRHDVYYLAGEPFDLSAYRGRQPTSAVLRELSEKLMRGVGELLGELRGETAPDGFYRRPSAAKRADAADAVASPDAVTGDGATTVPPEQPEQPESGAAETRGD